MLRINVDENCATIDCDDADNLVFTAALDRTIKALIDFAVLRRGFNRDLIKSAMRIYVGRGAKHDESNRGTI